MAYCSRVGILVVQTAVLNDSHALKYVWDSFIRFSFNMVLSKSFGTSNDHLVHVHCNLIYSGAEAKMQMMRHSAYGEYRSCAEDGYICACACMI